MPELRRDPIVPRWVVFSPERARRPQHLKSLEAEDGEELCPFCEGREENTPAEILAYRADATTPNASGWRVRVVPNKFPALKVEEPLSRRGEGIYDWVAGVGAHEVIIECPHHETRAARLGTQQLQDVLWAYRDRIVDLKRDARLRHVIVFKNQGALAGATLEHAHSQLIAAPVALPEVQIEIEGATRYYQQHERCVFCDIVHEEQQTQRRLIAESNHFVAVAPYAARFPFETWILPRQHASHFEELSHQSVQDLAQMMHRILVLLDDALDEPALNYVIHTAPFEPAALPQYHWHIEILPRIAGVAGFELGAGCFINPVYPEKATAFLRDRRLRAVAHVP
ncbi:MAG: galactose-1-phosphate uridylyltransferase [Planctomycetota bacterium]|nr:MAG: galactose-1-phosphate uridylyltransferase [Planctomycetota bacterium]